MSTDVNRAICERIVEEVNQGSLEAAATLLAASYIDHSDPPGTPAGGESAKQRWAMLRTAFPGARVSIEDVVAEGDKVAIRFMLYGTHHGALMGIPPTGKQVAVSGIDINRIANGQLVERWANFDMLGMLQQLGVIPTAGQTTAA